MANKWELCISVQGNTIKVAVCRANKKNKRIEIKKAFQLEIPEEFSFANDPSGAAVVGIIKTALKENGLKFSKYSLCISDRDIITRVIKLPKMELKDLKSFMKQSIYQYFPIKVEDYSFDFRIQGINEEDEKAYFNLFLVAIPKANIEYYGDVLRKCGLKPNLITIYSDVIYKLFSRFIDKDIAIMDISYNHTEFTMFDSKSIFINSIIHYNIPRSKETTNEEVYLKNLNEEELGEDFGDACETLENYINFFTSRHHGRNIEEIYFIGEGAKLSILSELESDLNIPVISNLGDIKDNIIMHGMSSSMRVNFCLERYCGCIGLVAGGLV